MDIGSVIFLAFIIFLGYRNGERAKLKEKSALGYGVLTVVMFFAGWVVGCLIVIFFFCKDIVNISLASNPANMKIMQDQLQQAFQSNPLHPLTMELFGIGGYLLVRYILENKPDKKKKLPYWPDNENAV